MTPPQTIAIVLAVGPVVLLLVFGIAALWLRSTSAATVCEVLGHGGFVLGGILFLYFICPRIKKILEDLNTPLDLATKCLVMVSDCTVNYWYLFFFVWVAGMVMDAVAFATFHRVPESRYVASIFSAVITAALLTTVVFAGAALSFGQAAGLLQNIQ